MRNPLLIELTRGTLLESAHGGAIALARADGEVAASLGDVASPVYPRSAIKPLQALPLVETGAAEQFGFGAPEIAVAAGSHSGTPRHVAVVQGMLSRAGLTPASLGCGVHEPMDQAAARELIRTASAPSPLHHNCSGKHAAMLATAVHMREPTEGYWRPEHPVQQRIARVLEDLAGCRLEAGVCGIDGCSVPNWAIPLAGLAQAFARFATGVSMDADRMQASKRVAEACWAEPDMVAGPGRLDTRVLKRLRGKVLLKAGAEGVYCGALPGHGLGFAIKIDDGAKRAAEAAVTHLLGCFFPEALDLGPQQRLANWRGLEVGQQRPSQAFAGLLALLP